MCKLMITLLYLSQTIQGSGNTLAKVMRNLGEGGYRLVTDEEYYTYQELLTDKLFSIHKSLLR